MTPKRELKLEALEAREVPALFGTPWPNPDGLTMSFAPDWTAIAGYSQDVLGWAQPSQLFTEMSGAGTTAQWQTEILRAFQTWAVNTNINIGLVPDAGSPFGPLSTAPGAGSSGQIRVGAFLASADVIAINQSFNVISGAWSGDLLFNTAKNYSIGAQTGKYDIFSVALNEAANIFGLADTTNSTSALYGHYNGVRTGLSESDITAIKAMYGTRTADAFETSPTTDYLLTPYTSPTDSTKEMVSATGADLTTLTDVDQYKFFPPAGTTSMTVRLQTAGLSLLNAKITIYNDKDQAIATATSGGALSMQDIVLTLDSVKAGKEYWIKVEKATNDVFGIGKYDLKVGFNFNPVGTGPAPAETTFTSDVNTNNTLATATTVAAVSGSANKQYVYTGKIESTSDVDYYKLTAPSTTSATMTVTIDPASSYTLYTKVTVYNASGAVVPSEVLTNGADGRFVLQMANPTASQAYYLKVEGVGRNGVGLTGNYTMKADFTIAAVPMSTVATSTLTNASATDYRTFTVPEAKLFHFTLSATSVNSSIVSGVRMIIYNASGQIIATLTAAAGATTSGAVFLNSGTYYLKFEAATKNGEELPNLTYTLKTVVLSDPIDPYLPPDPTSPPTSPPPPPPPDYTATTPTSPPVLPPDPWTTPWTP